MLRLKSFVCVKLKYYMHFLLKWCIKKIWFLCTLKTNKLSQTLITILHKKLELG